MRNMAKLSLALLTCVCSFHTFAARTGASSGDLRPVAGKAVAYESYVSNEGCETLTGSSPSFTGGTFGPITGYAGDSTFSSGKAIHLSCREGYVMVTMTSQTSGAVITVGAGGGQINNNETASCCPVKHRWATPTAA